MDGNKQLKQLLFAAGNTVRSRNYFVRAMHRFWSWLIDGRSVDQLARDEIRALAVLNIACLLAISAIMVVVLMLPFSNSSFYELRYDLIHNVVSIVLYLICWAFVRRRSAIIATLLISVAANVEITLLVYYYGLSGGIQGFYAVLMVAPLITLPGSRNALRLVLSALPLALFIWMHYLIKVEGMEPISPHRSGLAMFFFSNSLFALVTLVAIVAYFRSAVTTAESDLDREQKKSEALLLNILPGAIVARLKHGEISIADRFENVTVLFADLVHFTALAARLSAEDLVRMLDDIFTQFDDAAERLGLQKVKTIGDAYMAIGGAPEITTDHAARVTRFAIEVIEILERTNTRLGCNIDVRIGIHTGSVVGGVIGKSRFAYDFWGDTVNIASRMESHGAAGRIHISDETRKALSAEFSTEERGQIEIKGKGIMETHFIKLAKS